MAKKKLITPKGSRNKLQRVELTKRPHFDVDIEKYNEKHFGLYLIVANTAKADKSRGHNRLYIDLHAENEFNEWLKMNRPGKTGILTGKKLLNTHLLTKYPQHENFIKNIIKKIKRGKKRRSVRDWLYGMDCIIELFEQAKIDIPYDPYELSVDPHQNFLKKYILEGDVPVASQKRSIATIWALIRNEFNLTELSELPITESPQVVLDGLVQNDDNETMEPFEEESDPDEITLELLFQLDYFSQIELQRIMDRRLEYQGWIKELNESEENGEGLFSQANLLKTFYSETNRHNIRQLYIKLYNEDPLMWDSNSQSANGKYVSERRFYPNKQAAERHRELLSIAENGTDIWVNDEKMFAWWHKKLFPNWPFSKEVAKEYKDIYGLWWRDKGAESTGVSLIDFTERITPSIHTIYPLFLRILIDTDANTDTAFNIQVHKLSNGRYDVGAVHHRLRMLNAKKLRSNTVPPVFISKGTFTDLCIDFFVDWLQPIYDGSSSAQFLQYFSNNKHEAIGLDIDKVKNLSPLYKNNSDRNVLFFNKYPMYKSIEKVKTDKKGNDIVETSKERVLKIKHSKIRSANTYKSYLMGFGEWKSAHVDKGHQSDGVLPKHYQQYSWRAADEHQMAVTLLHIQHFVESKIIDKRLENAFKQPHCDCVDNKHPSFEGAPVIDEGEVCTSWRYCLTKCDKSKVFPAVHGATIMAWKILIENERDNFSRVDDWTKEYAYDLAAADAVVNKLHPEDYKLAREKAPERMPFVRLMMRQTKKKRKLANQAIGAESV